MNIIKFKDIILEPNEKYNENFCKLFNTKFKGKFCYWIRCTWAISFNDIDDSIYKNMEYNEGLISSYDNIDTLSNEELIEELIDIDATTKANSIERFKTENNFSAGSDITIEELKQFRTWLATSLLSLQKYDDDATMSMLEYYKEHMNDDIIRSLRKFSTYFNINGLNVNYYNTCGCNNNPTKISKDLLSNELMVYSGCDPIEIYKMGVYNKMVEVFSDMHYWTSGFETKNFLIEFKKYIDNIINCGLVPGKFVLGKDNSIYGVTDCMCITQSNQEANTLILKNLSKSLEYIINDDIVGHKNFIADSFGKWAKNLYEYMEWI